MDDRAGRIAGLTTRGRCLLAGGGATAVCALVLDERDLLRVGVFVALLPLLALLLARRTRRTVRVDRTLSPARLSVGGSLTVGLALHGSALLGAVRLRDGVPDAAGPQPGSAPQFLVHRASARRAIRVAYPLRPVLRGVHRIGPVTATATDPLGLAEFEWDLSGTDELMVLPLVVALRGLPPALGSGEGTPGSSLAHQGHGRTDVLVRPYRHGDELRRVHWRSSARHDELMVRLEERPWRGGSTVVLDRRESAHRGHGARSSLEFAVSLTASICAHLIGRGEPVALVTEDGSALGTGPTGQRLDPLLDALAALRPSARADLAGPDLNGNTDVVAVLGALGPDELHALIARRPSSGHAVLLDVATWESAQGDRRTQRDRPGGAEATAGALRNAGWRVTVATARSSVDRVWDELAAGALSDGARAAAT